VESSRRTIEEHDVVRFLAPIGRWPAGTKGTVISVHPDAMLVEMNGEADDCLDLMEYAPIDLLEVTWSQALQAAV
jgi:hypothetical protein